MREALKLALEALEEIHVGNMTPMAEINWNKAITAIKEVLAQPERHELQAKGEHPAPCARFCEANAFRIAERAYQRQICELSKKLAEAEKQEPVALMIYRGELCYKSQEDDQSFGMWCPVTQDLPFPEGTKFYTTPPQRKPLTDEEINALIPKPDSKGWIYTSAQIFQTVRKVEAKLKEKNT